MIMNDEVMMNDLHLELRAVHLSKRGGLSKFDVISQSVYSYPVLKQPSCPNTFRVTLAVSQPTSDSHSDPLYVLRIR